MQVEIKHLEKSRFEASVRGHRVICDQPESNGGGDAGMTPPEFLLVSLGTCAGFYAAQYLKTRALPDAGLAVRVSAEKATGPARLASFRIEVSLDTLDEAHRTGLTRAIEACLIHHTLSHTPTIETVLRIGAPPTA
jgi:putative redox protein